ncbi:pentapeptide repeat-containing protein [Actinoplanes sp. NPDC051494]|uniref:pentapeptide repeat-containing protein n=1 Tax=Actinoplanes sp. NPDC051494 TaxID=3363907 RepID=UPI0037AB8BC1
MCREVLKLFEADAVPLRDLAVLDDLVGHSVLAVQDLTVADLRDADLRGADLRNAINLSQGQLDAAMADAQTELPTILAPPVPAPTR